MIYLDNAATSWPKPPSVQEAMVAYMRDVGASPGRSGHGRSVEAERLRFGAREAMAELFGVRDPMRVIFTLNATQALNLVIHGSATPGSHVVATSMEHNAVLRPLREAERHGATVSLTPCAADGTLVVDDVEAQLRPNTRLIVVNHASNVCGTVLLVREIGEMARRRGIPLLVDAAQTAGFRPIDLAADHIDLLAFTGHKSLLGPSGTGGLVIGDDFDVARLPTMTQGGTGSKSEQELQPDFLPDKYESGTPNMVGIVGLAAGVRHVLDRGVALVGAYEGRLVQRLIDGLRKVAGVRVYGTGEAEKQTPAVSFTVEGLSVSDIAAALDERYAIMCRPGLHCAPRAHQTLGTFPDGTVRLSPGFFTKESEIDQAIAAVKELTREGASRSGAARECQAREGRNG